MENVQFEDSQFKSQYSGTPQNQRGMVGWLIKRGIVKDETVANYFLLGVFSLFIILTIAVYFIFVRQPAPSIGPDFDPATDPALFDPTLNP